MKTILSFITALSLSLVAYSQFMTPQVAAAECIPFAEPPNLFKADRTASHSATLYFTPLNDSIQKYIIDYGLSVDDRRYSVHVDHGPSTGAIAYTVNGLDPAFTYHYTVSAVNPCSQSPWSNWLSDAEHPSSGSATITPIIQNPNQTIAPPGSPAVIIGGVLTSTLVFGGLTFYRKFN